MESETKVPAGYKSWSILQLLGHKTLAGFVTEENLFGVTMGRIDVPPVGDIPGWTQYFGGASIYNLTPVGEDEARLAILKLKARPIEAYVVPTAKPMTPRLIEAMNKFDPEPSDDDNEEDRGSDDDDVFDDRDVDEYRR